MGPFAGLNSAATGVRARCCSALRVAPSPPKASRPGYCPVRTPGASRRVLRLGPYWIAVGETGGRQRDSTVFPWKEPRPAHRD